MPHHQKTRLPIILVFRNLFDQLLQYKYTFYKPQHVVFIDEMVDHLQGENTSVQLSASEDDDKTQKLAKRFGATFIITLCSALILFYILGCFLSHQAYREFKGVAEDCAGGSINETDGNVLHYTTIDKREEDAIEEKEEKEKRIKERQAERLGMGGDAMMMDEEAAPMMEGE